MPDGSPAQDWYRRYRCVTPALTSSAAEPDHVHRDLAIILEPLGDTRCRQINGSSAGASDTHVGLMAAHSASVVYGASFVDFRLTEVKHPHSDQLAEAGARSR
jgi:hypothetical protein